MSKKKNVEIANKLADIAVFGMQEKKANEIVKLDMREIHSTISDFFVICHADNSPQVNAIAKSVEDEVYKAFGEDPLHKEGHGNGEWILLDYGDVVVHIFKGDRREHYGLEELWGDAKQETYQSA